MDSDICAAVKDVLSSGTQTLILSSLDLYELPSDVFSKELKGARILQLNADYNDLVEIPKDIDTLCHLEELSVVGNQLKTLPKELSSLSQLKKLALNENELEMIPVELSSLTKLETINLVGNQITEWQGEFCECFVNLTELHLDENKLHAFPESFGLMKSLRVLEVCENNLSTLPESFGNLTQLETLNLSCNEIKQFPKSFDKLCSLRSLDISDNKLEHLPDTFNAAPQLQYFYADKNILSTLPLWFDSLHSLIRLGLSNNQLYGNPFPPNFGHGCGETLQVLDLSGNSIMELPESMGELKVLDNLHLGSTISELERRNFQNGNCLRKLPENFGYMKKVSKLYLDENQLIQLPESFSCLENLEWLDLGQNNLEFLPDSFGNLPNLWYLQLSKNHLRYLPESFGNLTKLTDLRLDNNNLTELPVSFGKLLELQTLDLFNNCLIKIPKVLFELKKLSRLDLDQNDFKVKAEKIPKLTGPQIHYAQQDFNIKDGNVGKMNACKVNCDLVDKIGIECLTEVGSDDEEDVEKDQEELNYNESALRNAMRKGLSIWKSHTGPDERQVNNRIESPPPVIYYPPVPSKSFCDDVFDDAEENYVKPNKTVSTDDIKQSNESTENENNSLVECEDWDREIELTLPQYSISKPKNTDDESMTFVNELQQLISSYPPAAQAHTKSAAYKSVVFDTFAKPINYTAAAVVSTTEEGQFDDADF